MRKVKLIRRSLLINLSLMCAIPSLTSCALLKKAGEIINDIGENVVNFVNGDLTNWWNDVVEGATKVYDDISKYVVNTSKTIALGLCDCYEEVKNGVITFYNGVIEETTIKEQSRATKDYELYKNDTETLIYSIISSELSKNYEVFPAYIYHPITNEVIDGIGYCDFKDVYKSSNGKGFYGAGFISGYNEIEIESDLYKNGIEIYRPEEDSAARYLYANTLKSFTSHFIGNNKYVIFGVNSNSALSFTEYPVEQYERNEKKYGGLYNYDTQEWVYGKKNDYITTDGSLIEPSCLNSLKALQNITGTTEGSGSMSFSVDNVVNCISNAAYLVKCKLQELTSGTLFGAKINEISKAVGDVKASDVVTIDNDGFTFKDIPESFTVAPNVKVSATDVAKTLVIITTVESFIGILVFACLQKINPAFAILTTVFASGMGCSLDLIAQLYSEGKTIQEVNWCRLIIKSIAGAISIHTHLLADALVDAIAESTIAFITGGQSIQDAMKTFSYAFVSSLLIVGIIQGINKLGSSLSNGYNNLVVRHSLKGTRIEGKELVEATESFANQLKETNAEKITKLNEDIFVDTISSSSANICYQKKITRQMVSDENTEYMKADNLGNEITKRSGDLVKTINAGEDVFVKPRPTCSTSTINNLTRYGFDTNNDITTFDGKYLTFATEEAYVDIGPNIINKTSRLNVYNAADNVLADMWSEYPETIPSYIQEYFEDRGIDVLTIQEIKEMRKNLELTWHEVSSQTLQLIPTSILKSISHVGGLAFIKAMVVVNNAQALIQALGTN